MYKNRGFGLTLVYTGTYRYVPVCTVINEISKYILVCTEYVPKQIHVSLPPALPPPDLAAWHGHSDPDLPVNLQREASLGQLQATQPGPPSSSLSQSACADFHQTSYLIWLARPIHHGGARLQVSKRVKTEAQKLSCSYAPFMSQGQIDSLERISGAISGHSKLWKARVSIPVPLAAI